MTTTVARLARVFPCVAIAVLLSAPACLAEEAPPPLPLKRIVAYSAGVAFFEHTGDVEGNETVELKFDTKDVNDLLKSMVLQDFGGGHISTVTYASQDPIARTLQTFAIDLTRSPSLADLLRQIRGHRVQVDAPTPIEGVIVGVEQRRVQVGKEEVLDVDVLNLKTDSGLRSVPLHNVVQTKLLDEKLDAEFQQALELLASAHSADKKAVKLDFQGEGKRAVRVGYIQEFPIWKTSYRLVLKDDEPPFLQGWAIVENTTEQDWSDVRLTLVSGRPISFVMDLYQPLYVDRPLVVPDLFASLRPRVYDQDLALREDAFQEMASRRLPRGSMGGGMGGMGGGMGGMGMGGGFGGGLGGRPFVTSVIPVVPPGDESAADLDLTRGVATAAQAGDVGELFRYVIQTPVSLPRQQSAMLPIVNEVVKGEKVAIYNGAVHAKHPLSGLKLTNSTDLHLLQGPITVFDGGEYAGDARIEDLAPAAQRLISYALDLEVEVAPTGKNPPPAEQLVSVRIVNGTLHSTTRVQRSRQFTTKNSSSNEKKVLIELPIDPAWQLVSPEEPAEKTRDLYRFAVQTEPGKAALLTITEQQDVREEFVVWSLSDERLAFYGNVKAASPEFKAALDQVLKRRRELASVTAQRALRERQIADIGQEQSRIRQNMMQLDRTSELYSSYVKKLTDQEQQIEQLRSHVQDLQVKEMQQEKELAAHIESLEVE